MLIVSFFRNKAVADGAVSYHIDHFVSARVAKFSYGTQSNIPFDSSDPEHRARSHLVYTDLLGHKRIRNHFCVVLPKVNTTHITFALAVLTHCV